MKYYFITFRSVTYAQRGERLLLSAGYRVQLRRTPKWMEEQGCGYSLRLLTGDIAGAAKLLLSNQLPLRKIYVQDGEGTLEEAVL